MGLFGGLFESKSSSVQTTQTTTNVSDFRAGAEGGGSAITSPNFEGSLIVGSDAVASKAIEGSKDALVVSTNFLAETFGQFLSSVDRSQDRAQGNISAANQLFKEVIAEEQEGANDQLMGIVKLGLIAAVGIVLIQSGTIKDLGKVFK